MNQLFTLKHFEINQINDQNYFKKRLKSYLSYTGRITSINLVQPAMDEENIGNPVDTGWSWVILFGSPSLVFLQSFFLKVITLEMTILREIYSILITFQYQEIDSTTNLNFKEIMYLKSETNSFAFGI